MLTEKNVFQGYIRFHLQWSPPPPPLPPCLSLTAVCRLPLVCVAALRPPSSFFLFPSPPQFSLASHALPPPASSSAWRRAAALSASPALGTLCRSLSRLWSAWPRGDQEEPKFKTLIKSLHRYLIYPQAFVLAVVISNKNAPLFQHVVSGKGLSAWPSMLEFSQAAVLTDTLRLTAHYACWTISFRWEATRWKDSLVGSLTFEPGGKMTRSCPSCTEA